ncbi:hypothetical protein SCHPADRAFT_55423 [Schizopora paradoxa]|uniref:Uncharacterized protein n=1 Tax=Schizopora paradoxa TaxID=27342 RepID=A0A0H2SRJ4_9AGAM|nr:hypothetical protein SCHPADRAFT_55423 [Schizopora paradoxa]
MEEEPTRHVFRQHLRGNLESFLCSGSSISLNVYSKPSTTDIRAPQPTRNSTVESTPSSNTTSAGFSVETPLEQVSSLVVGTNPTSGQTSISTSLNINPSNISVIVESKQSTNTPFPVSLTAAAAATQSTSPASSPRIHSASTTLSIKGEASSNASLVSSKTTNGLLQNKGEAAGVFTGVALFIVAIVVMLTLWWLKLRRAKQQKRESLQSDTLMGSLRTKWRSTTTITPSLHRAYAGLGKEYD